MNCHFGSSFDPTDIAGAIHLNPAYGMGAKTNGGWTAQGSAYFDNKINGSTPYDGRLVNNSQVVGDPFWRAMWIKINTGSPTWFSLWTEYGSPNGEAFDCYYDSGFIYLDDWNDAATVSIVPTLDVWMFISWGWDGTNHWIRRDDGARSEAVRPTAPDASGLDNYAYGGYGGGTSGQNISLFVLGDGDISDTELDDLYNAGVPLDLAASEAVLESGVEITAFFTMSETTGAYVDRVGFSKHLTRNDSPTTTEVNRDVHAYNNDAVTDFEDVDQTVLGQSPSIAGSPLWQGGVLDFDGVNDYLDFDFTPAQPIAGGFKINPDSVAASHQIFDDQAQACGALFAAAMQANAGTALNAAGAGSTGAQIWTFLLSGGASWFRVDQTDEASGDAGTNGMTTGLRVGANNAGTNFYEGTMQDLVFVDGEITSDERDSLEAWLGALS